MRTPASRSVAALVLVLAGVGAASAADNGLGSVLDALKRAQEQLQRAQPGQQAPTAGAQPQRANRQVAPGTPVPAATGVSNQPASGAPADWKSMPDIVGVHLHMPLNLAAALLRKDYSHSTFQPWPVAVLGNATGGFSINYDERSSRGGYDDKIDVNVTQPPNSQVVWNARRIAQRQNVHRGTLIAALREKYGKETVAADAGRYRTTDDRRTYLLYWLFNEQGQRIALPAGGVDEVSRCSGPGVNAVTAGMLINDENLRQYMNSVGDPNSFCGAYVGVFAYLADFGDPEIVQTTHIEMTNFPLALRAARQTSAWQASEAEKLRRQNLEEAKATNPRL